MMSAVATEAVADSWKLAGGWRYCTLGPAGAVNTTSAWAEDDDRRDARSDAAMPNTSGYWTCSWGKHV